MFKKPFSFDGRIGRLEYILSILLFLSMGLGVMYLLAQTGIDEIYLPPLFILIAIPFYWFSTAQGAKRCHDMGYSGWFQLIPLFTFIMTFRPGVPFENRYGPARKESE